MSRICTCMPRPCTKDSNRIFGAAAKSGISQSHEPQRAVFLKTEAAWPNAYNIKISFLGGSVAQRQHVKKVASKWLKYISLTFQYTENIDESDVRISFTNGAGSWSYVGRQCQSILAPAPTMNFGWLPLEPLASDRGTILHEFGHMLGLAHEHQNPHIREKITWNRDVIISQLSGPPNNWSVETIEANVLNVRVLSDDIYATEFDPESIMLYGFSKEWNVEGVALEVNDSLSLQDKTAIAAMYPKGNGWDIEDVEDTEEEDAIPERKSCCWSGLKAAILKRK